MSEEDLEKTNLAEVLERDTTDDSTEPWKKRVNLLLPLFSKTARDKKACKKCGKVNFFF